MRTIQLTPQFSGTSNDDGQVLYSASLGSGPAQLAFQLCNCYLSPLAPMLTSDGRLVIADLGNHRWVTVTAGTPRITPMPNGEVVLGATLGPGDIVYVFQWDNDHTPDAQRLLAYASTDLTDPVWQAPVHASPGTGPWISGQHVVIGQLDSFPLLVPGNDQRPSLALAGGTIRATYADGSRIDWIGQTGLPVALPSGDIVVRASSDLGRPPETYNPVAFAPILLVLHPNGTVTARIDTGTLTADGGIFAANGASIGFRATADEVDIVSVPLP